jgi:ATP-binding cassette subfamily F protein uup
MKNPNFLILDEPTNDLDLLTLTKLEEFLLQFKGCLILVSHDRFFMDKLTEHLFVFKGDGIIEDHYSSYSDYRAKQIKDEKEFKKIQHLEKENSKVKSDVKKLSFNEKYEFDNIEKELVDLENEKKKLEENLQKANVAINEVVKITKRLATVVEIIDNKELRWLELSEKQ